jgi:predicted acyltransferase
MAETTATATPATPPASQRLMSLDALRGFDMFWIIGADALVEALQQMKPSPPTNFLHYQLDHAVWEGFHFYDLIFPLFVFMMGASVVFSLSKLIKTEGRAAAVKRVFRRAILMFVLALIYSGGFSKFWPNIRLLGVLNRIALCYFFGGLIYIFCKPRAMVGIAAGLLLGYWAIMAFIPIRDIRMARYKPDENPPAVMATNDVERIMKETGTKDAAAIYYATTNMVTGKYEMGYNVANHFDFEHLPGKLWDTYWDPEGYVSTIPAIVTALLGIFAGLLLSSTTIEDKRKVAYLLFFGVAGVGLGFLWGMNFPVIKKIWTSSYVLVAGGYSALLLAAFYYIIDVRKHQKWCMPFVWIGMNSITIYMVKNFLGGEFSDLGARLVGGDVEAYLNKHVAEGFGKFLVTTAGLALAFWFANFLYRKKIFLRV